MKSALLRGENGSGLHNGQRMLPQLPGPINAARYLMYVDAEMCVWLHGGDAILRTTFDGRLLERFPLEPACTKITGTASIDCRRFWEKIVWPRANSARPPSSRHAAVPRLACPWRLGHPLEYTMRMVLFSIVTLCTAIRPAPAAERPNFLILVSDDQGYRDLGCAGSPDVKTPHLDRLASEGVRLTNFYVTWPACTPSRGSLLTGRYPQRNGTYDMYRNDVVDFDVKLDAHAYAVSPEMVLGMDTREVLLPRVLQPAGYTSGIFGKWDLGQLKRFLPLARGFDRFYGFANTGIDYFTHERYSVPSMRRGNELTTEDKGTYATCLFQREAVRFVKESRDRPFLLYVPFNAPHASSSLDAAVRGTVQAPDEYLALYPEPRPGDKRAERRRGYMAAVTCMDAAIGELLDVLDKQGLADNTLVIFFSDNGGGTGSDNAPLRGGKSSMFEGGLRVPCLVRWPGKIPAGRVCDEFLTSLEVFPTVLAAARISPPAGIVLDGFDMLPVLAARQPSPRQEMFWQRRGDRAARVGSWKWLESAKGSGLFDLSRDIAEGHDVSQERPEVLQQVKSRFAAWQQQMEAAEPRGPFRDY